MPKYTINHRYINPIQHPTKYNNNKKGYIDKYVAKSVSSVKTRQFKKLTEDPINKLLFHQCPRTNKERCLFKKKHKLYQTIPLVQPGKPTLIEYLDQNYRIFFNTDAKDEMFDYLYKKNMDDKTLLLNVHDYMDIVDSISGCRIIVDRGTIIATLVPRQHTRASTKCAKTDCETIKTIIATEKTTNRGKKRQGISEEYATIGAHTPRMLHGITTKYINDNGTDTYNNFERIVNRIETMASTLLPPCILKYAKKAKRLVGCSHSLTRKKESVWASAAMTYNYVSAAHVDRDSFISAITVMVETNEAKPILNDEIAVYFCLPGCGKAIGLRPGDVLFFNPLHYHCVSKRTKPYEKTKTFLCSLYLNTSVISGHDNRSPSEKV